MENGNLVTLLNLQPVFTLPFFQIAIKPHFNQKSGVLLRRCQVSRGGDAVWSTLPARCHPAFVILFSFHNKHCSKMIFNELLSPDTRLRRVLRWPVVERRLDTGESCPVHWCHPSTQHSQHCWTRWGDRQHRGAWPLVENRMCLLLHTICSLECRI